MSEKSIISQYVEPFYLTYKIKEYWLIYIQLGAWRHVLFLGAFTALTDRGEITV